MSRLAVIGTQWGDEGKGKVVDFLASDYDVVARFQGGSNAGHTIIANDKVIKLSVIPSGILRDGTVSIISRGVVLDPKSLAKEIEALENEGFHISPQKLIIDPRTPIVLDLHKQADSAIEKTLGEHQIGTTGRGIGSCYEDLAGRRVLLAKEIINGPDDHRIENLLRHHNIIRSSYDIEEISKESLINELKEAKNILLPYVQSTHRIFQDLSKKILFEGAQGVMLDLGWGTYPYVTSSFSGLGGVLTGCGLNIGNDFSILGVSKAYATRVGKGPFPTEELGEIGDVIMKIGEEIGTVTGRNRRCGWLDLPALKYALSINNIKSLAITKIDVLSNIDEIKICVAYDTKHGQKYSYGEVDPCSESTIKPIYKSFPGWEKDIKGIKKIDDLPVEVLSYIKFIEDACSINVKILSTGPERESVILR